MSSISIRPVVARDIADLLGLLKRFAVEAQTPLSAQAPALREGLFGAVPKTQVLVAQVTTPAQPSPLGQAQAEAAIVAFAAWHYTFDFLAGTAGVHLSEMYLDDVWRGQGIALSFFRTLARRGVGEGCTELTWSSFVRDAPGMRMYQSLSAIPVASLTSRKLSGAALRRFAE